MSEIRAEVFRGDGRHPERNEQIIQQHAEAVSQYYKITPTGGADKTEIREVISTPSAEPRTAHDITIPQRDTSDDPTLYAWYGPYGWCESYRKIVLAQCREIERAKASGSKVTESRLDDLARLNPIYLNFLAIHLKGRTEYEAAFLSQRGIS